MHVYLQRRGMGNKGMSADESVTLTLQQVADLAYAVLRRHGLAEAHVGPVAATIIAGERDECASHGVYRLLNCVHTLNSGKVVADAVPVVHHVSPALLRVDAAGGFAQLAFATGLPLLVEKARAMGIAAMGINRCVLLPRSGRRSRR